VLHWGLALLLLAAFVHWATGLDGQVEFHLGDHWVHMNVSVLLVAAGLLFIAFHLLVRLWGWVVAMPERRQLRVALDNQLLGEAAKAKAVLALFAGETEAAREEIDRARRLLGETPTVLALAAQAARAAGDEAGHAAARAALARNPDARLTGVGQDHPAAALPADAPGLLAQARGLADPAAAAAERRALAADPGFAPAALAVAARLAAAGQAARARETLAAAWARCPDPALGAAYLEGVAEAGERLRLVDDLTRTTVAQAESRVLRARAALDAGDLHRARFELEAWEGTSPDRRWCWLMEALERAERGEAFSEDTARYWRDRAENEPPAPAWVCGACGSTREGWEPTCGSCGTPGQVAWTGARA
jgi:HemY protein